MSCIEDVFGFTDGSNFPVKVFLVALTIPGSLKLLRSGRGFYGAVMSSLPFWTSIPGRLLPPHLPALPDCPPLPFFSPSLGTS